MFKHLIIIIALFLLQACASTVEQSYKIDMQIYSAEKLGKFVGAMKEGEYANPSIPARLELPQNWFLTLADKQVIIIDDSPELVTLDPLVRNSYRLLYLLKYQEVPVGKYNTSLIFMTSDNVQYIQSTTAAEHNERIKVGLAKSGRDYRFDSEPFITKRAGQEFSVLPSVVNLNTGVKVYQEYQTAIMGDKLMTFILTFTNEKDQEDLEGILNTLTFK